MWSIAALNKLKGGVKTDQELCDFIINKVSNDEDFCALLVNKIQENAPEPIPLPPGWRCETVCVMTGFINVTQAGAMAPFSCPNGATITRTGVGLYEVTPPPGSLTHSTAAIVDEDTRDSVMVHFDGSFSQGTVHVTTSDNGANADTLVDAPFTIQWFGRRDVVVCDDAEGGDAITTSTAPVVPTGEGEGGEGGDVRLYEPCPFARANFFNETQFSWGFSVQNGSNTEIMDPWQFVINNATYQINPNDISNNTAFTYTEIANADGTFTHVFTGNAPLGTNGSTPTFQLTNANQGFDRNSESQSVNCG